MDFSRKDSTKKMTKRCFIKKSKDFYTLIIYINNYLKNNNYSFRIVHFEFGLFKKKSNFFFKIFFQIFVWKLKNWFLNYIKNFYFKFLLI